MSMGVSRQITYNTAGNIVTLFCQWMIIMIIPRMTDFAAAGVFAVALSICSIFNVFATFRLDQYQLSDQYVNFAENDYRVARNITIALSFGLCLIVLLFFNYTWEQNLVIILYMVYRNLLHYAYIYAATLQINDRWEYVGKCMMLEGVVSFTSFALSYYITGDLVVSTAVMAVLGGGVFLLTVAHGYVKTMGRKYPRYKTERPAVSSLMKIGTPLMLALVAPIVITALPRIILQATDGDELTGIFGTLAAPTIIVPTLIAGVFAPFIIYFSNVSRHGDMPLLRKQYSKTVLLTLALGVAGYALSCVAAGYLFELVYGDEIVPYVKYFCVLMIGITFYSIGMWGITVLITKEQGRAAAVASGVSLAIAAAIFAYAIPGHGISGATYGLMAAYGIFGLIISLCVILLPLDESVVIGDEGV